MEQISHMITGQVAGASTIPIEDHHPVEWLRGKQTIEIVVDSIAGMKIGSHVVITVVPDAPTE